MLVTIGNSSKNYGASVSGLTATSAQYVTLGNVLRNVTFTAGVNGHYTYTDGLGTTGSFTLITAANSNSNVGNYSITLDNFVKSGTNFTYLSSQNGHLAVNPLAATLGTASVNKVYNGNTVAQAVISLNNRVGADDVSAVGLGSYTDNKNVGASHTYSVVAQHLTGAAAGNYYLTSLSTLTGSNGVITEAPLTISGISASNKIYNGDVQASVSTSNATLSGMVVGDDVTVNATGTFANKNVAVGKVVTLSSTYGGSDRANYSITDQAFTSANITPAPLTISGVTASNKTYDGTAAVSLSTASATLSGVLGADVVTVSAQGAFANKNVGQAKGVTINTYDLGGADGGNYSISGQTSASADISPALMTISGITAQNKTFNGNTVATVNAANVVKTGLVSGDVVTVSATGAFADDSIGANKLVSLTSTYSGADVGNYTITDQVSTFADILAATTNSLAPALPPVMPVLPLARQAQDAYPAGVLRPSSSTEIALALSSVNGSTRIVERAEGVQIRLVSAPTAQSQGVITVVLPQGTTGSASQILIPVADQIGQYLSGLDAREITVNLPNNLPLPQWIQFRADENVFVLSAVPKGALPLMVAMTLKDVRFLVRISESGTIN